MSYNCKKSKCCNDPCRPICRGPAGAVGATGATGENGVSGSSAIIPFSSGDPITLTATNTGAISNVGVIAFGSSIGFISLVGGNITSSTVNGYAYVAPRAGTITNIYASMIFSSGFSVGSAIVTVNAQVYTANSGSATFSPLAGTSVNLTPTLTGAVPAMTFVTGSLSNILVPIVAGQRYILVYSITTTNQTSVISVAGRTSAGISIS